MIKLECHCGAVKIAVKEAPETVTACNCSVCRRYATLWSYGTIETIQITAKDADLDAYLWKGKELAFVRCHHCGCVTHWESRSPKFPDKVAVNMRNAAPEVLARFAVRHFDGAESWTYLD